MPKKFAKKIAGRLSEPNELDPVVKILQILHPTFYL